MIPLFYSQEQIISNSYWIVLVPFLAGFSIILLNYILGAKNTRSFAMLLSVGAVAYGFVHSLMIFECLAQRPGLAPWQANALWFSAMNFKLYVGVLIDNLASLMLIVVTAVSLLVQVYTHGYMREDPGYSRFYSYLSLFTGSMLGLVVSTNLFQMYFFWELVGVCSYFLIGFWWYKVSAAEACLKAFVVNRIGDCGFLVGILLFLFATKDFYGNNVLLGFVGPAGTGMADVIRAAYGAHALTAGSLTIISILVFLGPIAKSAQFPLHVWLPDAMEGPTPISALIHAATMVAAGVYLVARAYPLWLTPEGLTNSPGLAVAAWTGGFTAFMAATIALTQYDIKRTLAWSTVSQLGYMFVGLGAGAFTGGIFHLFNHAFFKAMLFLCSGAVIHGLHGEQDMRKMGGLMKSMPITGMCFLIGCLSISGIPGLSGFFSKDEIIGAATHYNGLLGGLMIFTALLTSFYMFRMFFLTFTGEYRGDAHPHESPLVMTFPLMALAIPSVVSGYLGFNFKVFDEISKLMGGQEGTPFPSAFGSFVYFGRAPHFEGIDGALMAASICAGIGGAIAAWWIYTQRPELARSVVESKNPVVSSVYHYLYNKWRWDEIYLGFVQKLVLPTFSHVWNAIDVRVVDAAVNVSSLITLSIGEVLKYTENGRGQHYAMVIFAWVAGLSLFAFFIPVLFGGGGYGL